jgi:hypothetical protein
MLAISCMAGPRLYQGWHSQKMVFFGQYRDWGPFDRKAQPIRFWLCTAWITFATLAFPIWVWGLLDGSLK